MFNGDPQDFFGDHENLKVSNENWSIVYTPMITIFFQTRIFLFLLFA